MEQTTALCLCFLSIVRPKMTYNSVTGLSRRALDALSCLFSQQLRQCDLITYVFGDDHILKSSVFLLCARNCSFATAGGMRSAILCDTTVVDVIHLCGLITAFLSVDFRALASTVHTSSNIPSSDSASLILFLHIPKALEFVVHSAL